MSEEKKEQPKTQQKPVEEKKEKQKRRSVTVGALKEALINYIVPLISVAATVLIGLFVLMPSYKELPELEAQLDKSTALEAGLRKKLNNLNKLVDFGGIVEENSGLVNKVLVSEELVPGLLTQIDRLALEAGLTVNILNYGLGSSGSKEGGSESITYNIVTTNLDVTGSFSQLKAFMKNVENAARLVLVDNFRFSQSKTEEGEKLGINFVLISPFLYVESDAITDEPIDLDIGDDAFLDLINKIKNLKYYDPYEIDLSIPVEEAPVEEGEETLTPEDTPEDTENPEEVVLTGEGESEGVSEGEGEGGADSIFPQ